MPNEIDKIHELEEKVVVLINEAFRSRSHPYSIIGMLESLKVKILANMEPSEESDDDKPWLP